MSEDSQFTADEMEVAGILSLFQYYWGPFLQWGAKRRRSAIQRKESSAAHNSELFPTRAKTMMSFTVEAWLWLHHQSAAGHPPLRPNNSKQRRNRRPDLKDCNVYLKSQLASCLKQQQEQNLPLSSSQLDTRPKTETTASACDHFQSCDKHGHFGKCSSSPALGSAYNKPQMLGRPMYSFSPESSFGSEMDSAMPTKDTVCSGSFDLNTPHEALSDTIISKDLHGQMPMPKNKAAAAEARKHRTSVE